MTATLVGAHFLAGSILTLLLPVGLVVLVALYWGLLLRRRSTGARSGRSSRPHGSACRPTTRLASPSG